MKWQGLIAVACIGCTTLVMAQDRRPATKSGSAPSSTKTGSPAASGAPRTTAAPGTAAPGSAPSSPLRTNTPAPVATTNTTPSANKDYASYAIGYDLATRLKSETNEINIEMLIQGLKDSFAGGEPRFPQEKLRAAAEAYDRDMQARAQARFQQLSEKQKKDGAAFLDKNRAKKTVKITASGLQYEIVKSGNGKTPKASDKIRAHYQGTLIDGTVFDTTLESEPIEIDVQGTIPGWVEALQMMKVGDKWRLYVPPALAYGEQGYGPVPPNATLVFDIELLDVLAAGGQTAAPPQQSSRPRQVK